MSRRACPCAIRPLHNDRRRERPIRGIESRTGSWSTGTTDWSTDAICLPAGRCRARADPAAREALQARPAFRVVGLRLDFASRQGRRASPSSFKAPVSILGFQAADRGPASLPASELDFPTPPSGLAVPSAACGSSGAVGPIPELMNWRPPRIAVSRSQPLTTGKRSLSPETLSRLRRWSRSLEGAKLRHVSASRGSRRRPTFISKEKSSATITVSRGLVVPYCSLPPSG